MADVVASAGGSILSTIVSFASGGVSSVLNLFGAKPVGDKGWATYIAQAKRPVGRQYYPSAAEILAANVTADPKELAAIASTYDQNTGQGTEGDWHFAVTSTNPIVLDWFKGDTQHFQTKSNAQFASFANTSPIAQGTSPQTPATLAAFGGAPGTTNAPPPSPQASSFVIPSWAKWVAIGGGFLLTIFTLFLTFKRRR
jgi:hypothetical protein